jgi:hypothetical protein
MAATAYWGRIKLRLMQPVSRTQNEVEVLIDEVWAHHDEVGRGVTC